MDKRSYFEIGGLIMDGTAGYHHVSGKKIERGIRRGNAPLVARGVSDMVTRNLSDKKGVPYSEGQLALRGWVQDNKRTLRGITSALPLSAPVTVGIQLSLTGLEMLSYARGAYDLATPEMLRYEESVFWGGSGGRII